ncbi:MAG: right-handed parallel beta-helix repeat-containing protein [Thermoplasmata archaeon]|nr:right-handed parallel beta-helix repeat-containing protein [Thermoplasmata archaeon]
MRRGRRTIVVVCLLIAGLVTGIVNTVSEEASAYTPHAPIDIMSDGEFTGANGVTGGSGSSSDPYIIEGWEITADTANGIRLFTTSAWVIIRNIYVYGGNTSYDGIRLWGSLNVRIENCTISTSLHGIRLDFSTAEIVNNTITSNYEDGIWFDTGGGLVVGNNISSNTEHGINFQNGGSVRVTGNNIFSNGKDGLRFWEAVDSTASDNNIFLNGIIGIGVGNSENITVVANNLSSNQYCIWPTTSMDVRIIGNNCSNHFSSMRIDTSSHLTVMGNNFSNNSGGINTGQSDNVVIVGNNFTNSSGVSLDDDSNRFVVMDNLFTGNGRIDSHRSRDTMIIGNTLSDFLGDIYIYDCDNFTISGNTLLYEDAGIRLENSHNITVQNNTFAGYGISIRGDWIWHWNTHVIDTSNTVDGDPVVYWKNVTGGVVPLGAAQAILANSSGAVVENLDITDVHSGVQIGFSSNNIVANNTISNTYFGAYVYKSDDNTINNNTVLSDTYDVYLEISANNAIYHNNFIDMSPYPYDDTDLNQWDDDYPSGGNYWSDYAGVDDCSGPNQDVCPDPDGIGDTPYLIDFDSQDRYPLMSPHGTLLLSPPSRIQAVLSGRNLENVSLTWTLSLDDGSGFNTVVGYRIYRNMTFDPNGLGYGLHASLSNGVGQFDDFSVGEGDSNDYFYQVCSFDIGNNETCAPSQAGKFTRPLTKGLNLVSIPLVQVDESTEEVLQTVSFDKAWTYGSSSKFWKSYMPFKTYKGDLMTIDRRLGVWVSVLEDSNLTVAGTVPMLTAIQLRAGWNLIGYPSFNTALTVGELRTATGATSVEGFDPNANPYFLRPFTDMEILVTGFSYWLLLDADILWTITNT